MNSARQATRLLVLGVSFLLVSRQAMVCGEPVPETPTPDEMVLYSLDGIPDPTSMPEGTAYFHRAVVLGKTSVAAAKDRREIMSALQSDFANPERQSKCFYPRHGLRVVTEGETVDYLICYQCHGYLKTENGHMKYPTPSLGRSSKAVLNRFLRAAKVPLAPGAD